jgi:hypothetical protein
MGKSFTVDLRSLHGLDTHQLAAVALEADRLEALYEGRGREAVATLFGVIAMGARSLMKRPAPGEHAGFVVHDPSAPKLDTVDDLGAAIAAMLALANDSGAHPSVRHAWRGLVQSVEAELRRRQAEAHA